MSKKMHHNTFLVLEGILNKIIYEMPDSLAEYGYYSLDKDNLEKFFNPVRTIYKHEILALDIRNTQPKFKFVRAKKLLKYGFMADDNEWVHETNPAFVISEDIIRPVFNDCISHLKQYGFFNADNKVNYLNSRSTLDHIGKILLINHLMKIGRGFL